MGMGGDRSDQNDEQLLARVCGLICDLFSFPVGKHVLFYRPQADRIVLVHTSFTAPATCRRSSAPPNPRSCGLPGPAVKIWYPVSASPATIRT